VINMEEEKKKSCRDCVYWRRQSGSTHVVCPARRDFSLSWEPPVCGLYLEGEPKTRECDQFAIWAGEWPEDWPKYDKVVCHKKQ